MTNVAFRNIKVDGTGTNVVNARVGGFASFENVDARNVGAPFVNNCGTFHFTGTPEFDVRLLGTATTAAGPPTREHPVTARTGRRSCRRPRRVPGSKTRCSAVGSPLTHRTPAVSLDRDRQPGPLPASYYGASGTP